MYESNPGATFVMKMRDKPDLVNHCDQHSGVVQIEKNGSPWLSVRGNDYGFAVLDNLKVFVANPKPVQSRF